MLTQGTWWQILDISHSSDAKTIKRAYAKLIKEYRPDSHPEEFTLIRQAYEAGKTYAANNPTKTPVENATNQPNTQGLKVDSPNASETIHITYNLESEQTHNKTPPPPPIEKSDPPSYDFVDNSILVSQKTIQLMTEDFENDIKQWQLSNYKDQNAFEKLRNHPALNNIESFARVKFILLSFIVNNIYLVKTPVSEHVNISLKSIKKLDDIFNWSSNDSEYYGYFDEKKYYLTMKIILESHKPIKYVRKSIISISRLIKFSSSLFIILFELLIIASIAGLVIITSYTVYNSPPLDNGPIFVFVLIAIFLGFITYRLILDILSKSKSLREIYLNF